jgi:hypothetical protein
MTKRRRGRQQPRPRPTVLRAQVQCATCRRYHFVGEACGHCHPATPAHCHCDDLTVCHLHIDQALFDRLWQIDLESIDESILLPTDMWEDDEEARSRQAWREDPDYRAWLRHHPQLRERARRGVRALWALFDLTELEGEILDKQAFGYTVEAIAQELAYRPGGIQQLLAGAQSKIAARMTKFATTFRGQMN